MAGSSLTPVLAQALLDPDGKRGRDAVRAALLHLVALGHLGAEVEPKKVLRSTRRTVRLRQRENGIPLPPELAVVLEALFPLGEPVKPLGATEVVHRLQKRFGAGFGRYSSRHLRPELVNRGWLRVEEYRVLGIFPRTRHQPTGEGERLRAEVEERLRSAAEVPQLLEREPERALGIVAGLGALVVLSEALRPHYGAIAEAARAHGPGIAPVPELVPVLDEDERRTAWMDAMEMLSSLDWAGMLEAFESMGDAFDGGADAGGGDGGGGGGE